MSEFTRRQSAYAGLLVDHTEAHAPGSPGITMQDQPDLGFIVLRGSNDDADFLARTEQSLGIKLPIRPSTSISKGEVSVLWISPDEWWILSPLPSIAALRNKLEVALQGLFVQVIDNSAGLCALRLSGGDHLTVLRHLCPYPVERIETGSCISTVFPKANVTLLSLGFASTLLISRRSYAPWISGLLIRSARPYGLALLPGQD